MFSSGRGYRELFLIPCLPQSQDFRSKECPSLQARREGGYPVFIGLPIFQLANLRPNLPNSTYFPAKNSISWVRARLMTRWWRTYFQAFLIGCYWPFIDHLMKLYLHKNNNRHKGEFPAISFVILYDKYFSRSKFELWLTKQKLKSIINRKENNTNMW